MTPKAETVQQGDKMTVQEAIDYLGISRATLNRRIDAGAITPLPKPPYLKRRHKTMFLRADVERLKNMEA
ncbi:DNA-binding protein [bacterium]|nr:MAG: DNA-binding protein [bacterium]